MSGGSKIGGKFGRDICGENFGWEINGGNEVRVKVARKMAERNLLGKSLGRERVRCCNIWARKRLGWKCHAPLGVPVAEKDISASVKPIRPVGFPVAERVCHAWP